VVIQDSIRQILSCEWDPLGLCDYGPKDEYDSYIAPVYRILVGSRSEGELIDFLHLTESETIGMPGGQRKALREVARKLLALDVRL
jgi:hypothetical protein